MYRTEDFFAVFHESAAAFLATILNYCITYFFKLVEYIKNIDYYTLGVKALVFYSNVSSQSYKFCKKLYNKYPAVKNAVDRAIYSKDNVLAIVGNYKIEPYVDKWVCASGLIESTELRYADEKYKFNDTYDFVKDEDADSIINVLNINLESANSLIENCSDIKSLMVSLKYNSSYSYRVIKENRRDYNFSIPPMKSKVRFISIEYTNPNMKSTCFIDLNKNEYMVGNEILSHLFIKRYFSYRSNNFRFNPQYTLNIIDGDLNTIQLQAKQYILLREHTYEIINC
jgi:hypothetical protein